MANVMDEWDESEYTGKTFNTDADNMVPSAGYSREFGTGLTGGGLKGNTGGGGARAPRPGDWVCTGCSQSNFASRNECFKCHEEKSADAVQTAGDQASREKPREQYIPPEPTDDENVIFATGISSGINFDNFDKIAVKITGDNPIPPIKTFADSHLREFLLKNVERSGYSKPTPIQRYAIPNILARRDMIACAQTGSGKTAAFLLPMLHIMLEENKDLSIGKPQAVIMSPTRELAIQIFTEARKYSMNSYLKVCIAYGGTVFSHQGDKINQGCHILVCTPGRLFDFVDKGQIQFDAVRFIVLDEADRMLDLGFKSSIEKMMNHPTMSHRNERQTLMFSATFPEDIQMLAGEFLKDYIFLAVGIVGGASADVEQNFIEVTKFKKLNQLMEILDSYPTGTAEGILIFTETKRNTDLLASMLSETKIPATSIHGDRLQREREEAIKDFKTGKRKILIATNVAARGLDIKNVTHVMNYDLPKKIDDYVHRIGRTGRVGNRGKATSFYDPSEDSALAPELCRILTQAGQPVPAFLDSSSGLNGEVQVFGGRDIRAPRANQAQESDEEW